MGLYLILLGLAVILATIFWEDSKDAALPNPTPYRGPLYNRHGREIS